MSSIEDAPQIIAAFASEFSPSAGQCDACPAGMAVAWLKQGEERPTARLFVCPPIQTVRLDAKHWVIHAPSLLQPIVLNDSALALARHYHKPRTLDDVPLRWLEAWGAEIVQGILKQMVHLGLLMPEEFANHSSI